MYRERERDNIHTYTYVYVCIYIYIYIYIFPPTAPVGGRGTTTPDSHFADEFRYAQSPY